MLIRCPECELQVSNKAYSCPHCGYPIKDFPKNSTRGKSRKRLKLPNGFGRITKIKGRVRKPYRAMVTVGKDEAGRPIGKLLKPVAYFDTYNEAYTALLEYNKTPYDLTYLPTVSEVYERWFKARYSSGKADNTIACVQTTYGHLSDYYDTPFRNIRIKHIKHTMEGHTHVVRQNIKSMWNMMFDYAMEFELTDKNYARIYKYKDPDYKPLPHLIFTEDEMRTLWKHSDEHTVQLILIQCYSGLRPTELLTIDIENIDFDNHLMIGGMKTDAGKDRIIPIHPLIENMVRDMYDRAKKIGSVKLVNGIAYTFKDRPMNYDAYRYAFKKTLKSLGLLDKHKLHDGKKHFVTLAKKYEVNEFAIKRIVGHSLKFDITENIYTERDSTWLYTEILKIAQY